MSERVNQKDVVTIEIEGAKRIRQEVVDRVVELVLGDELLSKFSISQKNGAKVGIVWTLEPSEGIVP